MIAIGPSSAVVHLSSLRSDGLKSLKIIIVMMRKRSIIKMTVLLKIVRRGLSSGKRRELMLSQGKTDTRLKEMKRKRKTMNKSHSLKICSKMASLRWREREKSLKMEDQVERI
jgi:hypothetical protein